MKPSTSLVRTLSSPVEWLSEIIYILRPLIYGMLVSHLISNMAFLHFALLATLSATNKDSSRPLITALVMEMVSRNLRRAAPAASALERVEYSRRDRDMLWYFLRGSIWEEYTRYIFSGLLSLQTH